jgi:hypothetical protein
MDCTEQDPGSLLRLRANVWGNVTSVDASLEYRHLQRRTLYLISVNFLGDTQKKCKAILTILFIIIIIISLLMFLRLGHRLPPRRPSGLVGANDCKCSRDQRLHVPTEALK